MWFDKHSLRKYILDISESLKLAYDLTTKYTDYDGKNVTLNADGNYYYDDGSLYSGNPDNLQKTIRDADGNLVTQDDNGTYYWVKGKEYTGDVNDIVTQKEEHAEGVIGALRKLSNSIQKVFTETVMKPEMMLWLRKVMMR